MNSPFFKSQFSIIIVIVILIIFISLFFIPTSYSIKLTNSTSPKENNSISIDNTTYAWPTPGYNKITSGFGTRTAPTKGATSSHPAIDIAAPPGTNIVAISSGKVLTAGWTGAGGYTVTILLDTGYTSIYCHTDPNMLVKKGDLVKKGQVVARVGPLNVYGIPNNPYKDKNGNPTNGATTGPHLHFAIKKGSTPINPLSLY